MTIFVWNIRGFNKKGRKSDVQDHIHKLSSSIVALVETKVKLSKVDRLSGCVPRNWTSCNNFALSAKGRIWVAWDPDVWSCFPHAISEQQITLFVKNKGGLEGYLTVVYVINTHVERMGLWRELKELNFTIHPWLLTGDFNTTRFTNEKVGGKQLTYQQLSMLTNVIGNCS